MRLIIVIASILCTFSASAQSYIPMLGETNIWNGVSCFFGCTVEPYYTTTDTIVDGNSYKILDGFHYIERNFLVREDVTERKVYMKLLGNHQLLNEYPLFDFSLESGDTTNVYNPFSPLPEDGGLYVLDSIVSRPLENGNHRFFYLHAVEPSLSVSEGTVWIEGVGALSLINTPGANRTESNHLGCAFKDGVLQYAFTDSIGSCSNLSTENHQIESRLSVFPSLFSNEVNLTLSKFKPYQLQVYSTSGQLVYEKSVFQEQSHTISSRALPKGLLVFVLLFEDGSFLSSKAVNLAQ